MSKINDWLQVIGFLGVIASLIFVGIQLKQTQDIALASTYNARASQTIDANAAGLATPQYYSGMAKIYSDKRDQLTAEEYIALEQESTIFLTIFENNHYQYTVGFLPEEHWQKNLMDLDCRLTEPFTIAIAMNWQGRESFRAILEASIERGLSAVESCWVSNPEELWSYFNPVE